MLQRIKHRVADDRKDCELNAYVGSSETRDGTDDQAETLGLDAGKLRTAKFTGEAGMATKRVIAYAFDATELAQIRARIRNAEFTESFAVGDLDDQHVIAHGDGIAGNGDASLHKPRAAWGR